jgi:hypothetical protein
MAGAVVAHVEVGGDVSFDRAVAAAERGEHGESQQFASRHDNAGACRGVVGGRGYTEPFPSWLCFAELQYVDGLGELTGAPAAAAEFGEDLPGLEPPPP